MANSTCSIPNCGAEVEARGWCKPHYGRWRHSGSPTFETQGFCEIPGCGKPFIKTRPISKYCSLPCRRRSVYLRNIEQRRADSAVIYQRDRAKILAYQADYYANNREKVIQRSRDYYAKNAAEVLERERIKRESGAPAARIRARRADDPIPFRAKEQKRRALLADAPTVEFTPTQLAQRLAVFGFKCWMCGAAWAALDHVKPLNRGGSHMLSNLRPACRSCNSRKRDMWFGVSQLHVFNRA